jgi:hypothetical protein
MTWTPYGDRGVDNQQRQSTHAPTSPPGRQERISAHKRRSYPTCTSFSPPLDTSSRRWAASTGTIYIHNIRTISAKLLHTRADNSMANKSGEPDRPSPPTHLFKLCQEHLEHGCGGLQQQILHRAQHTTLGPNGLQRALGLVPQVCVSDGVGRGRGEARVKGWGERGGKRGSRGGAREG